MKKTSVSFSMLLARTASSTCPTSQFISFIPWPHTPLTDEPSYTSLLNTEHGPSSDRQPEGSQEGRGLGRRTVDVHVREGVVEEEGRPVLGVLVDEAHPIPRKVHRQVAVVDRLLDEALPAVEEADGRVGRRQVDLLS